MLESEKLAIAAHLHVAMRRKIGRVTDVEWMLRSPEYAREIIRIALSEPQYPELQEWAARLAEALFPANSEKQPTTVDVQDGPPSGFVDSRLRNTNVIKPAISTTPPRYVGGLR
jgi:hypothetical protein